MSEAAGEHEDGAAAAETAAPADNANGDIEVKARQMGWRPREEFRGPDARWVDAATFVERGDSWVPFLQERNKFFERTVETQQREIDDLKGMIAEGNDRLRRSEQIGYKRAMRELEARKAEAISNADPQEVRRVEQEIQELGPEPKASQQPAQQKPKIDPIAAEWVANNPWVREDSLAWETAEKMLNRVQAAMPGISLEEQLAEVKRRVMPMFVRDAARRDDAGTDDQGARRSNPPPVTRSSSVGGNSRRVAPRSFDAMPDAVKAQFAKEQRVLDGKGQALTKEEYATYYWEQFPEDGA